MVIVLIVFAVVLVLVLHYMYVDVRRNSYVDYSYSTDT
jgi:hypothetical protein